MSGLCRATTTTGAGDRYTHLLMDFLYCSTPQRRTAAAAASPAAAAGSAAPAPAGSGACTAAEGAHPETSMYLAAAYIHSKIECCSVLAHKGYNCMCLLWVWPASSVPLAVITVLSEALCDQREPEPHSRSCTNHVNSTAHSGLCSRVIGAVIVCKTT